MVPAVHGEDGSTRRDLRRGRRSRPDPPGIARRLVRELTGEPLHLADESVRLRLPSILDLLVTCALLRQTGVRFTESNPVARWFFARGHIAGMTLLKLAVIGSVIALCEVIERRRPGWGRGVLRLGSLGAAGVVADSVYLFLTNAAPA